jgi:hypothetical protein
MLLDGVTDAGSRRRVERITRLFIDCRQRITELEFYVDKLRKRSTKQLRGS